MPAPPLRPSQQQQRRHAQLPTLGYCVKVWAVVSMPVDSPNVWYCDSNQVTVRVLSTTCHLYRWCLTPSTHPWHSVPIWSKCSMSMPRDVSRLPLVASLLVPSPFSTLGTSNRLRWRPVVGDVLLEHRISEAYFAVMIDDLGAVRESNTVPAVRWTPFAFNLTKGYHTTHACKPCPAGTFTDEPEQSVCQYCPSGQSSCESSSTCFAMCRHRLFCLWVPCVTRRSNGLTSINYRTSNL